MVLIHNAMWISQGSALIPVQLFTTATVAGWTGVQLFFVLSGFLISGILLDALGSPTFFRTFYVRRTLRIFPLYYGFLVVAFVLIPLFFPASSWTAKVNVNQWWYWTYLGNFSSAFGASIAPLNHFWSLAVEEQFYLGWPLLIFALGRRQLIALCLTVMATSPLLRLVMDVAGMPHVAAYEFTFARWDALATGALLIMLLRDTAGREWLRRHMRRVTSVSAVAILLLVVWQRGFEQNQLPVQVLGQTLISVLSASLIYFSVIPASKATMVLREFMSARWLRFLGKYSYAIYVFHYPIQYYLQQRLGARVNGDDTLWRLPRFGLYIAVVAALSILAALVSWRVLEKPMLSLKERLAPRRARSLDAGSGMGFPAVASEQ